MTPYQYTYQNPINLIDPNGMSPKPPDWYERVNEDGFTEYGWFDCNAGAYQDDKGNIWNHKAVTFAVESSAPVGENREWVNTVLIYGENGSKSILSPNEYGMVQFPESGRGFSRYTASDGTNSGNNENYLVNGVRHSTDNWASPGTATRFYNTIQEFYDQTNVSIHYGDISAYDPGINLGHSTHFIGNSIDIHYMGSNGVELRGSGAYLNADVGLTNRFFRAAQNNGFNRNYSYGNRFNHNGNNNQSLHKDHLHIGR